MSNCVNFYREFWQDNFVLSLTPEEKYFYIYLFTNDRVSTCGIYQLPKTVIEFDTGYNNVTLEKLLKRFENYGKVKYRNATNEICLINFLKNTFPAMSYQQEKGVIKSLDKVRDKSLIAYLDLSTAGSDLCLYVAEIKPATEENKVVEEPKQIVVEPKKQSKKFIKPTIEEIKNYCDERQNEIDPEQFFAFYESKGWKIGNTPMKNWQSAVITWEKRQGNKLQSEVKSVISELVRAEYDEFYAEYPVKTHYELGLTEFAKLRNAGELPPLDNLIDILYCFINSDSWENEKYIPSIKNWLQDKRFKDDLEGYKSKEQRDIDRIEEEHKKFIEEERKKPRDPNAFSHMQGYEKEYEDYLRKYVWKCDE